MSDKKSRRSPPIKTDPELLRKLEASAARYRAMSDEERDALHKAQRESWLRANMPTGDPRFD